MKKHALYLKYIVRHKWFVFVAGLTIGAPLWRLIVHDLSKFRPSEWLPYAKYFYGKHQAFVDFSPALKSEFDCWSISKEGVKEAFDKAWLLHQHRNPHHWQYWILREDSGDTNPFMMPRKYVLEMVADWMGAGRAITGKWDVVEWYEKNKGKMELHHETVKQVDELLTGVPK